MGRYVILMLIFGLTSMASELPRLSALRGAPPYPRDNPPTAAKVQLGEELFFDSILSGNRRRSCSTCHKRELHFTDGLSRAWGLDESELTRKTPSLSNVGWQRSIFFDGRVKTLEEQVAKPLENHREMALDPDAAVDRIRSEPFYVRLFQNAFPGEDISFDLVSKAIASFERTLVSYDSDLDRYLEGVETALSPAAKRGLQLFQTKAECVKCHHGPLLTDHQLHYTGVAERDGHGVPGAKYKTQSLRDSVRRYSYMHNGRLMNIRQVIEHYNQGGSAPPGLQAEIKPLGLSDAEKDDLIAFLYALNGRIHQLPGNLLPSPESAPNALRQRKDAVSPEAADSEAASDDPSYLNR